MTTRKMRGTRSPSRSITPGERRLGAVGRWWHWTDYEIRNGSIAPSSDAQIVEYEPWDRFTYTPVQKSGESHPYLDLLVIVDAAVEAGFEPGARSWSPPESIRGAICEWCNANGLLGVLLHQVERITLAARWDDSRTGTRPVARQVSYVRSAGWATVETRATDLKGRASQRGRLIGDEDLPQQFSPPCIYLHDLAWPNYRSERLTPTWFAHFPSVPKDEAETFAYPQPLTEAFWRIYTEPVVRFLEAGCYLLVVVKRLGAGVPWEPSRKVALPLGVDDGLRILERLLAPVRVAPGLDGRGVVERTVMPTLLSSLSAMILQQLSGTRRIAICKACGRPFPTSSYQGVFCSDQCRWRSHKRRRKAKKPESSRSDAKTRRSAAKRIAGRPRTS